MRAYLELLRDILENGERREDRTGTGTISVFGRQVRFDLSQGFPLLTTKKLHTKSIFHELLWFLRGDTNIAYLKAHGVSIWDEWADSAGNLGPVYGSQWRAWPTLEGGHVDQIAALIQEIKVNPSSRRLLVNAWNVGMLKDMALPPCHLMFQFYVSKGRLSCQLYCRSQDVFLGTPFNIASYALLVHLVAAQCDLEPFELILVGGDLHLYSNHVEQAQLQLSREPRLLPRLKLLRRPPTIFDYTYEDFAIEGYDPHPHIKADVST